MSQQDDDRVKETMKKRAEDYFARDADMHATVMSEEGFQLLRGKIQNFIQELPVQCLMVCELPKGQSIQFATQGMPTLRAIGLLQYALSDNAAGITSHRVLNAIRMDREYGKQFEDE